MHLATGSMGKREGFVNKYTSLIPALNHKLMGSFFLLVFLGASISLNVYLYMFIYWTDVSLGREKCL